MKKIILYLLLCLSFNLFAQDGPSVESIVNTLTSQVKIIEESNESIDDALRKVFQSSPFQEIWEISPKTYSQLIKNDPSFQHAFHYVEDLEVVYEYGEPNRIRKFYALDFPNYLTSQMLDSLTNSELKKLKTHEHYYGLSLTANKILPAQLYKEFNKGVTKNQIKFIPQAFKNLKLGEGFGEFVTGLSFIPRSTLGGLLVGFILSPWFADAPLYLGATAAIGSSALFVIGTGAAITSSVVNTHSSFKDQKIAHINKKMSEHTPSKTISQHSLDQMLKAVEELDLKIIRENNRLRVEVGNYYELVMQITQKNSSTKAKNLNLSFEIIFNKEKPYREVKNFMATTGKRITDIMIQNHCAAHYFK